MTCYHPLQAYRSSEGRNSETGKWPIVFSVTAGYADLPVTIPCGQCIGCRLERSRQWAMRCVHEASLHEQNSFITLTYDNEHLPVGGSLNVEDMQGFWKRLRRHLDYNGYVGKLRYFQCGEYGSTFQRPHHHAIVFGFDFPDRILWSVRDGVRLYRSPILERLWPFGFSSIGDVTFESCAYVARYVTKKITGEKADDHYQGRKPEYCTMSRRPGIAADWVRKFLTDVYPQDYVVIRDGLVVKPPKFYDDLYDRIEPGALERIKSARRVHAHDLEATGELSPHRMKVKEAIKLMQFDKLKRGLEEQI